MKEHLLRAQRGLENVEVFLKFEASDGAVIFTDSSPKARAFARDGTSTTISTEQYKIGSSSCKFLSGSQNKSSIYTTVDAALSLSTKDFTIEGWFYPNTVSGSPYILQWGQLANGNWVGFYIGNGTVGWAIRSASLAFVYNLTSVGTIPALAWSHVAVERTGNTITMYLNGVADNSSSYTGSFNATVQRLTIGELHRSDSNLNYPYTGFMDQIRITIGKARYNGNFIPGE